MFSRWAWINYWFVNNINQWRSPSTWGVASISWIVCPHLVSASLGPKMIFCLHTSPSPSELKRTIFSKSFLTSGKPRSACWTSWQDREKQRQSFRAFTVARCLPLVSMHVSVGHTHMKGTANERVNSNDGDEIGQLILVWTSSRFKESAAPVPPLTAPCQKD